MSNLGLSQLTDDQLLELLQESCSELAARDPFVRREAQKTIIDEAQKLKVARKCIKQAVRSARRKVLDELRQEIEPVVQRKIRSGEITVLSAEEESAAIKRFAAEYKEKQQGPAMERLRASVEDDCKKMIRDGRLSLFTEEENNQAIEAATKAAHEYLKQRGVISLKMFQIARRQIIANLESMGHTHADIMLIYGNPEK